MNLITSKLSNTATGLGLGHQLTLTFNELQSIQHAYAVASLDQSGNYGRTRSTMKLRHDLAKGIPPIAAGKRQARRCLDRNFLQPHVANHDLAARADLSEASRCAPLPFSQYLPAARFAQHLCCQLSGEENSAQCPIKGPQPCCAGAQHSDVLVLLNGRFHLIVLQRSILLEDSLLAASEDHAGRLTHEK